MNAQVVIDTTVLAEKIEVLISEHGGLRKAAKAIGMDFSYLSHLRNGHKTNPSAETLHKLGLSWDHYR